MNWSSVAGSTLVAACAYDEAAARVYVRLHSGVVWVYEDCSPDDWREFMTPGVAKDST